METASAGKEFRLWFKDDVIVLQLSMCSLHDSRQEMVKQSHTDACKYWGESGTMCVGARGGGKVC